MDTLEKMRAKWDAEWAELNRVDAAAKAKGELVGRYITHAYADGNAVYRIKSVTAKNAKLEVVDIGDGWVLPAWGAAPTLPLTQVRQFLKQRDGLAALFKRSDDFYANLRPGQIVHYANGFNEFVRCEVVATAKGNQLKPVALVGEWRAHDLPHWTPWGEPSYPYHVKQLREGELMHPHESNIYEARTEHRPGTLDPRKLAPVALDLPERTPEEIAKQMVCARWNAVRKALEVDYANGDTHEAAMDRAKTILNSRVA